MKSLFIALTIFIGVFLLLRSIADDIDRTIEGRRKQNKQDEQINKHWN